MHPFLVMLTVCLLKIPHILISIAFQLRLGSGVIIMGVNTPLLLHLTTVVAPMCTLSLVVVGCFVMMRHRLCVCICVHFYGYYMSCGMLQIILTCYAGKCDKNGPFWLFIPHTYFSIFELFMNIFTSFRNNILY